MVWLPDGENSLTTRLAVLTEYRRVADGETDRRTSCDAFPALCINVAR